MRGICIFDNSDLEPLDGQVFSRNVFFWDSFHLQPAFPTRRTFLLFYNLKVHIRSWMIPEISKIWLDNRCSLIILLQGCRRMLSQTNLTFCSLFLHSLTASLNPLWFIFPLEWNFSRGLKPSTRRASAMLSCSRLLSSSDNKLSLVPLIRWWSLWWLWL